MGMGEESDGNVKVTGECINRLDVAVDCNASVPGTVQWGQASYTAMGTSLSKWGSISARLGRPARESS